MKINKSTSDASVQSVIESTPSFAALTAARAKCLSLTGKLEAARKSYTQASTEFQMADRRDDVTIAAERLLSGEDALPEMRKLSEIVQRAARDVAVLERAEGLQRQEVKRLQKLVSTEASEALKGRYVAVLDRAISAAQLLSAAIEEIDTLREEAEATGVKLRLQSICPAFGTLADRYSDFTTFVKEVEIAKTWPAVQLMRIRECTPRSIREIDEDRARAARGTRGATFDAA